MSTIIQESNPHPQADFQPAIKLLKAQQVTQMVQLSRTSIHTIPDFPKPVRLGTTMQAGSRWIESEIIDWINARAARRNKASAK